MRSKTQATLKSVQEQMRRTDRRAGGFKTQPEKIISGGPMMGMAMFTTDVPAVKTFSCFLAFTKDEVAANQPSNCIRCGRCVSVVRRS